MASNTLKVGKRRVPKFPEVAGRDERIADLRKKMTDLYDASVAEASRIEGMTPKVDGRRFPGGAR